MPIFLKSKAYVLFQRSANIHRAPGKIRNSSIDYPKINELFS